MSDLLPQADIEQITGYTRQRCQERALRDLGYIVLGRNAKNRVQALAIHPQDPRLVAARARGEIATLDIE